jgi:hypothetical protein
MRRRTLRFAGIAVAVAFRLVPQRLRFPAAALFARAIEPFIRHTRAYQTRAAMRVDGLRETSLQLVLMLLTRYGTTFDPLVQVAGAEHLPPAGAVPLLLISPHTMLSLLFPRVLHDRCYDPLLISADPIRFYGTTTDGRTLLPSPAMFFEVRRAFRSGGTVMSMIDRGDPERRNELFQTAKGPFRVSSALIRLALRSGARIVFFAAKIDPASRVVIHLGAPSHEGVAGVVNDFVQFVDETLRVSDAPPGEQFVIDDARRGEQGSQSPARS